MRLLQKLRDLFGMKDPPASPRDLKWLEGNEAFGDGMERYATDPKGALECFDKAIDRGFEDSRLFALRGTCLQAVGYDLDAIDDFNKAIIREPNDCNLYFQRSISRGAVGDFQGRVADLLEAIRLARVGSRANDAYSEYARENGWTDVAAMYAGDLESAKLQLEHQANDEELQRRCPGAKVGPDLATRLLMQAKRRPERR